MVRQIIGAGDAILNVDDTPLALQLFTVFPPISGAAAVIDIEDRKAAAGPVLNREAERATGRGRWAAVAFYDQRGFFRCRRLPVGIMRAIIKTVGDIAAACEKLNGPRLAKIGLQRLQGLRWDRIFDRGELSRVCVQCRDGCRRCRRSSTAGRRHFSLRGRPRQTQTRM